ncbi:MAG: DUF3990 domain-containing protein [Clostridia bacterium]|nr:DUF3990 domain-containing protein [Clostridia bacterium]
MILYHGSCIEIEKPVYGAGATDNDYGQGFYMTKSAALGSEWAVHENTDGYLNKYNLDARGLHVLDLTSGKYSVLHWLNAILANRAVDITSEIMDESMEYLKRNFSLNLSHYDCITGWHADDLHFSLAMDFLASGLSYDMLCKALHLWDIETQYELMSPKAFERISFLGSEPVRSRSGTLRK